VAVCAPAPDDRLYTPNFWLAFGAATVFMVGQSLMYTFVRYVVHLGGDESDFGWIVGVGVVATLLARPWIGGWLDRFGTVRMWALSLAAYAAFSLSFLLASAGPGMLWVLFPLRVGWAMSFGVIFACATAYPAQTAPPSRRAEAIGTQGMGGFAGSVFGPWIADALVGLPDGLRFPAMFGIVAVGTLVSAAMVACLRPVPPSPAAPRPQDGDHPADPPAASPLAEAWRYFPGPVSLMGVCFGVQMVLVMGFVARHADREGVGGVGMFYLVYALGASWVRAFLRRLPEMIGRRSSLLLGIAAMVAGYEAFPFVRTPLDYAWPAALLGTAHGLIFPSMVDLAGDRCPPGRRGLGTSLILGCMEFGQLVGGPAMGLTVEACGFTPLFHGLAVFVAAATVGFLVADRRDRTAIPRAAAA
jgi:MFS family permease